MKPVVHEIRNHLAVAVANVEAFRDGVRDPTSRRLTAVLRALVAVELLLRDLAANQTAIAPLLTSQMRRIDMCDLIANQVLGLEAAAAGRVMTFTMHHCAAHGSACLAFAGDPLRIGEMVNNIVANAVRYSPHGGRIDVACRRTEESLVLSVTDDGPGVQGDEAETIFEAGVRGSASVGTTGTGAGLALVRRFAREHGGSIAVTNVLGRGACFTVTFPMKHRVPPSPCAPEPTLLTT